MITTAVLKPVASAVSSLLASGTQYSSPQVSVESVYAAVVAALDYSGRTKQILNTALVLEHINLAISKTASDFISSGDTVVLRARKNAADAVSVPDVVTIVKFFLRVFADSAEPADAVGKAFNKLLSASLSQSSFALQDEQTFAVDLAAVDSQPIADINQKSAIKVLAHAVGVTEALSSAVGKSAIDSVAPVESAYSEIAKAAQDSVGAPDSQSFAFTQVLEDLFALNDTSTSEDGSTYAATKYINNVYAAGDTAAYNISKVLFDAQALAESGNVISQGYCDLTYFESNYIGEYREFA